MDKETNLAGDICIPDHIRSNKSLTLTDKVLLSIYYFYTEKGDKKCCVLTKEQLSAYIGVSARTIQNSRQHLVELELIKTNNGNKVWYVAQKGAKSALFKTAKGAKSAPQGSKICSHNNKNNSYTKDNLTKVGSVDEYKPPY